MKMMMIKKRTQQQQQQQQQKRFLMTVNVVGSPGPLRLVVNEDDKVSQVICSCLKMYARGGRLPVLGSDINNFCLYPSNAAYAYEEAMEANEAVGCRGERRFVLCKKQTQTEARFDMLNARRSHGWKACFKILSLD